MQVYKIETGCEQVFAMTAKVCRRDNSRQWFIYLYGHPGRPGFDVAMTKKQMVKVL